MMTQRNVELQLQALDLIERRHHSTQKDDEATTSTIEETVTQVDIALVSQLNNYQLSRSTEFLFSNRNIAADESAEKELFEEVEKELVDETRPLSTDDDATNDKFQRLNLFFEKEKVSTVCHNGDSIK